MAATPTSGLGWSTRRPLRHDGAWATPNAEPLRMRTARRHRVGRCHAGLSKRHRIDPHPHRQVVADINLTVWTQKPPRTGILIDGTGPMTHRRSPVSPCRSKTDESRRAVLQLRSWVRHPHPLINRL